MGEVKGETPSGRRKLCGGLEMQMLITLGCGDGLMGGHVKTYQIVQLFKDVQFVLC